MTKHPVFTPPRARLTSRRILKVAITLLVGCAVTYLARPILLWIAASDTIFETAVALTYGRGTLPADPGTAHALGPTTIGVERDRSIAEVDPRFLSVAIDTSQVAGGNWWSADGRVELGRGTTRAAPFDFSRSALVERARALAPAYLRIGGTEADVVYYDLGERPLQRPPEPYELVLTRSQWNAAQQFTAKAGLELFLTINAGPGDRDGEGRWRGRNAEVLLQYARANDHSIGVLELGNEVGSFWFTHGLRHHLTGERYAADVRRLSALGRKYFPGARIAAGAAFVWPVMGEPPPKLLPDLVRTLRSDLDVLTWHYYPEQSRRCWSATRRARPGAMLEPRNLDEIDRWSRYVNDLRDAHSPGAEVWLGESGGAQCGGEPGISDRFASSFWWLDQLGATARAGQRIAVRQTLVGSHYGLLDDRTLEPRPDYWASLLWKENMGERVLRTTVQGSDRIRSYAHCAAERAAAPAGSVSLLLINTDPNRTREAVLPDWAGRSALLQQVTASALDAKQVQLNRAPLQLAGDRTPELRRTRFELDAQNARFDLPPRSYTFVLLPEARAPACL